MVLQRESTLFLSLLVCTWFYKHLNAKEASNCEITAKSLILINCGRTASVQPNNNHFANHSKLFVSLDLENVLNISISGQETAEPFLIMTMPESVEIHVYESQKDVFLVKTVYVPPESSVIEQAWFHPYDNTLTLITKAQTGKNHMSVLAYDKDEHSFNKEADIPIDLEESQRITKAVVVRKPNTTDELWYILVEGNLETLRSITLDNSRERREEKYSDCPMEIHPVGIDTIALIDCQGFELLQHGNIKQPINCPSLKEVRFFSNPRGLLFKSMSRKALTLFFLKTSLEENDFVAYSLSPQQEGLPKCSVTTFHSSEDGTNSSSSPLVKILSKYQAVDFDVSFNKITTLDSDNSIQHESFCAPNYFLFKKNCFLCDATDYSPGGMITSCQKCDYNKEMYIRDTSGELNGFYCPKKCRIPYTTATDGKCVKDSVISQTCGACLTAKNNRIVCSVLDEEDVVHSLCCSPNKSDRTGFCQQCISPQELEEKKMAYTDNWVKFAKSGGKLRYLRLQYSDIWDCPSELSCGTTVRHDKTGFIEPLTGENDVCKWYLAHSETDIEMKLSLENNDEHRNERHLSIMVANSEGKEEETKPEYSTKLSNLRTGEELSVSTKDDALIIWYQDIGDSGFRLTYTFVEEPWTHYIWVHKFIIGLTFIALMLGLYMYHRLRRKVHEYQRVQELRGQETRRENFFAEIELQQERQNVEYDRLRRDRKVARYLRSHRESEYGTDPDDLEQTLCPLCEGELEEGCVVRTLDCEHFTHSICLEEWLRASEETVPFCPTCGSASRKPAEEQGERGS
mmetsp:Transcript_58034/g.66238  ORF Transcript_58034/g.66238 Transcript_58034/m.66238 type:complete len:798 (-) Transcript_58034:188-2581(-)